ncbi:MAG: hypothetical protein N2645_21255 [Clostridia bacterium]|nr:hypothetical protein [Clostridia bacterium]
MTNLRFIFMKCFHGIMELLFIFPFILIVCINLLPTSRLWPFFSLLIITQLAAIMIRLLFLNKMTLITYTLGILFTLSIVLAVNPFNVITVILWFLLFCTFIRGVRLVSQGWSHQTSDYFFWFALGGYFFSYFIFKNIGKYYPYFGLIEILSVACVLLCLLRNNLYHLQYAASPRSGKPELPFFILKLNTLFLSGIFVALLAISSIHWVKEIVGKVVFTVVKVILILPSLLLLKTEKIPPATKKLLRLEAVKTEGTGSLIDILLQAVFKVILAIAAVAIILVLIELAKSVYKHTKIVLRKFFKVSPKKERESFGFIDYKEKLDRSNALKFDYKTLKTWLSGLFIKEPKWENLKNNQERIRYIYRQLLLKSILKGYPFKRNLTPSETCKDILSWEKSSSPKGTRLASLYNLARYGSGEIKDREVEEIKELKDGI